MDTPLKLSSEMSCTLLSFMSFSCLHTCSKVRIHILLNLQIRDLTFDLLIPKFFAQIVLHYYRHKQIHLSVAFVIVRRVIRLCGLDCTERYESLNLEAMHIFMASFTE